SKYKIYIIDEVHMLSKAAWNALLKTVEEPPAHVKFIFATTEAHLVLPTIVSRCQRFDLRPIAGNLILQRLKLIAESENVKIAPEALSAIARAAEGGMRDAQSSLEQMLAFFGGKDQEIAAEQVLELFGLTNAVELDTLIAAMLQNQPGPVVTIVNQLAGRGRNLETLFDDVLEMLRGAELMQILNTPEAVLDFDDEKLARCRKLSQLTTAGVLRCFMENLAPVGRVLHEALNKAIYLESILLKAMHEAHAPTVGDVLNRLNQLRGAGELQFVDRLPSFQERPAVPVMPVVLPEETTVEKVAPMAMTPPAASPAPVQPEVKPLETAPEVVPASEVKDIESPAAQLEIKPAATPEPAAAPKVEIPEVVQEIIESAVIEPAADVAENIQEPQTPKQNIEPIAPAMDLTEHEALLQKMLQASQGEIFADALQQCHAVSLINAVLTLEVPAAAIAILRDNRLKLLTLLQQITGNWASLIDFKSASAIAPENPQTEVAPAASEAITPSEITGTDSITEDIETEYVEPIQSVPAPVADPLEDSPGDIPESNFEQFIDLNGDLPDESNMSFEESDYVYSKRSVIHKVEEVEATAKLPPVQKVLDLFGGEIVDIHA
ncbi:MAG: hypothetical protein E7047_06495, partial [Lentisphaerae bacterium]|nr:hypothetical protein [Lentisphaerota bacterium]